MKYVFDIETNGLYSEATELHCIAIRDLDEKVTKVYTSRPIDGSAGTLEEGLKLLQLADKLIGHNIINFDIPTIHKLTGVNLWDSDKVEDTFIMSKLAYPNMPQIDSNRKLIPPGLKGNHSLEAWGHRLRKYKGSHDDWTKLSIEMVKYCKQDVEVNTDVYNKIISDDEVCPNDDTLTLEQKFANIMSRQEKYGWLFDTKGAEKLHLELIGEMEKAKAALDKVFKPMFIPASHMLEYGKPKTQSVYKKKFPFRQTIACHRNDGDKSKCRYEIHGDHQPIKLQEFNPGSGSHIVWWIERLFGKQHWDLTDKGTPKTGRDDLLGIFKDKEWAQPLVHCLEVEKLLGQLATGSKAWLKKVDSDGRMRGSVNTLGAVTRRCTHSNPNVAQVPANGTYKGKECRALFTVPKGRKLIGCDAEGLELRTLAHYMGYYDGGEYGKAVDEGDKTKGTDVHTLNQEKAGLPTRDKAKTFIYALLYGAGPAKIGAILDKGPTQGKRMILKFLKELPALDKLKNAVEFKVDSRGYLLGLDGHKFFIRSKHSALNVLLQGAGAIVMKYYTVMLDAKLQEKYTYGIDYEFVGNIHDEVQIDVDENIAEDIAKIAVETFDDVTEYLNFRVPLRGSVGIGENWSETH